MSSIHLDFLPVAPSCVFQVFLRMRVYKTLSTATEMMKNTWKRVLKNNQSYLSDPEKQKVLRFAMQRPALYLNELEACMEQILAETLEEAEKTA